jgi:type IV pilus assembly protein PilY1
MNMKTTKARNILLAGMLATAASASFAEDIDIYSQNTSITPGAPNVLLIMDNTANWSQSFASDTKFSAEKAALAQVITALKTQFNLGLMMFTETGGDNSNTDGGYVRFAIQAMTDSNGHATNARFCLLQMIGGPVVDENGNPGTCVSDGLPITYYTNLDIIADKSNGGKGGVTMGEAYDYFAGANAYAGNNKVKADPRAFTSQTIAGPQYNSPFDADSCQKNFIIVLNNGPFSDNQADTSTATTQLNSVGGSSAIAVINPPDNGTSNNNEADEWTRFLNKTPAVQAVTYTLEVGPATNGGGPYNTALLQSMGTQGKGGYFSAIDAATLNAALTRIFNDIQAVNSVFASSSLPLSADNTGNFANQVYMAVFRPDGAGLPRWLGNLKQYKFAVDSNNNLYLADADGVAAASSTSGFAASGARSFWTSKDTATAPDKATQTATDATTGSTNGFWYFDSKGDGGNFDSPDGEWVEKGGAAEQLRLAYLGYGGRGGIGDTNTSTLNSKPARLVYTCTGTCLTTTGTALSGTPFDSTNVAITGDPTQFGIGGGAVTVTSVSSNRSVNTAVAGTALSGKVSSLVATSTLVTVTMSTNHGLPNSGTTSIMINGSSITGTNGTFAVTKTGNRTFTYPVTGVTAGTSTGTPTAYKPGTLATITTTTSHGLSNGMAVTISGAVCPPSSGAGAASTTNCAINGTSFTVANKTATTFQITLPSAVGATAGGTIVAASTVARVTTAAAHGYSTGDSVTIANATCSPTACAEYNTTATIFNLSTSTFDFSYSATAPLPVASNSGITSTDNTSSSAALVTLMKWVRGQDTQNENGFQVAGLNTDVRASIHGDILHSRPVILNYAASGATTDNVYVFYGGNDGVFRAIKGGQATTDGKEQWAFIPKEFFPALKRQYDNSPAVLYPSTPSNLGATRRTYAWDGPVVSYVERNSSGVVTKAYLYLSSRRGGRFIYALDVTAPTNPKLLWRKGCTTTGTTTTCDTGYAELGQTWSTPAVATVQASEANGHPVLIFGGGYDPASEDPEPPALTDAMGRAVFVVDATNGSVVWSVGNTANSPTVSVSGMDFAFTADVLALDRHQTGYVDRVYAADIGGNVWRIDTAGTSTSSWAVHKLAALGNRTAGAAGRKFLFGPEAVFGLPGTFDAVVIGSGDREHPLATNAANDTANRAYMLVDPNTGTTGTDVNITESDLFDATNVSSTVDLSAKKGWFVGLRAGEKVINGPLVVASQMFFGTNQPCASGTLDANGECSSSGDTLSCTGNLGIARRYDINYLTAAPAGFTDSNNQASRSEIAAGGGFLPTSESGVV